MKKYGYLIFLVLISGKILSQRATYLKAFTEGNFLLLEKNYDMALQSFKQAYAIDSINSNVNYKVGLCYMNMPSKKKKAMSYMEKAIANVNRNYHEDEPGEKAAPRDAYYYYGKSLHLSGKFEEAIAQFEKYKQFIGSKDKERLQEVQRQIETCRNAILLNKSPENILIKNLGDSINTPYPDYGPVINADESILMYTSRRPGSTGGERGPDNSYYDDIYMSKRKPDGSWAYPSNVLTGLNTNSNEATIGLSEDGQKLYIYKDINGGDIYYSSLTGNTWSAPVPFGDEINSPNFETHLTISADSSVMYFSGERPGGMGGGEIYTDAPDCPTENGVRHFY